RSSPVYRGGARRAEGSERSEAERSGVPTLGQSPPICNNGPKPSSDNTMSLHIEVINLTKRFRDFTAVDGVSFGIREGICFGLLGPNGAGKSTTIEMIEGIKLPSSGELRYRGRRIDHSRGRDREFAARAGIQFQSTALMDF